MSFDPIIHDLSKHHFPIDRDGHPNDDNIEGRSEREEAVPQTIGSFASSASKLNADKRGVYFDSIPLHRQDPDGFNNDIFYWCDGGNGTSYLHFFDDEERVVDCGHAKQSTRLVVEPPPPILISNDVVFNYNDREKQREHESGKCAFGSTTNTTRDLPVAVPSTESTTSCNSAVAMFVTLDDLERALTKLLYAEFGSKCGDGVVDELGILQAKEAAAEGGTAELSLPFELRVLKGVLRIVLKRSGTSSRPSSHSSETALLVATSRPPVNSSNNEKLLSPEEIEQSHRIVRLIRFLSTRSPPSTSSEQLAADGGVLDVCGIVLGASRPVEDNSGDPSIKSSNGTKKLCLYVAPIKIVRDSVTHPSAHESVNANVRPLSLLRKCFSVTPARVILLEGAQVDPESLTDVTHTITHDSPFFPGGQSLLTCPAAVALKRKSMRGATSATTLPQTASKIEEEGAGVRSFGDLDAPFETLVGCDVGTHVDSPQHFFADADHKNIVDLKAHGHLIVGSDVSAPSVPEHCQCACAQKLRDFSELVAPVVVVDVREQCTADPDYLITIDDIARAAQETTHSAATNSSSFDALRGALVVGLTGWGTKFEEATMKRKPEIYQGIGTSPGDNGDRAMHFPGFSPEAAHFLLNIPSARDDEKASVSGIGIDTLSLDRGLSEDFQVHQIMLGQGNKYQVENMNLGALRLGGSNNERRWYAIVLPAAVHGAFEANACVSFVQFT